MLNIEQTQNSTIGKTSYIFHKFQDKTCTLNTFHYSKLNTKHNKSNRHLYTAKAIISLEPNYTNIEHHGKHTPLGISMINLNPLNIKCQILFFGTKSILTKR